MLVLNLIFKAYLLSGDTATVWCFRGLHHRREVSVIIMSGSAVFAEKCCLNCAGAGQYTGAECQEQWQNRIVGQALHKSSNSKINHESSRYQRCSDRLPDEMISEYRVFSGNPADLLTGRFVPHPFRGRFAIRTSGAERLYQRFFCRLPAAYPVRRGT